MKLTTKRKPRIHEIKEVHFPPPQKYLLKNGIPVYDIRLGNDEVVKLELVFHCGRPFEHKRLASRATAQLLKEGTRSYPGADIAETFDFYGASLSIPVNLDYSTITIYTLKRHFEKLMPILTELISQPAFPEKELISLVKRSKQRLSVDLSKNDVVAYRLVTEKIFGENHYYGFNSSPELYDDLNIDDIRFHFEELYGSNHCQVFLSGKTDDSIIKLLDETLGQVLNPTPEKEVPDIPIPSQPDKIFLHKPESTQAAIRIGRHLFGREHPDHPGMFVLNTILGGYFGSRLMTNVREEKGYTYNIYSNLDSMRFDGYFYIASEVGQEFVKPALKEIYREMEKLARKPVTKTELQMVRRYLMGNMLTMLDGPFNISEVTRTLIAEDAPENHFRELVETIKSITPQELQLLAQKYFVHEKMWEVVVD